MILDRVRTLVSGRRTFPLNYSPEFYINSVSKSSR